MDSYELSDIKRRLIQWKEHSPAILYSLLDNLFTQYLTSKLVSESKICRTLKALAFINLSQENDQGMFPLSEYHKVFEKAKCVYKKLNDIQNGNLILKEPQKLNQPMVKQSSEKLNTTNLFLDWKESFTNYIERLPYLNGIAKQIILNLQQKGENVTFEDKKIKEVVTLLEKTIYDRNYYKENRKQYYEEDLRTLCRYLKSDKSGVITMKLMTGGFSPREAGQLRSEDWLDSDKRIQQIKVQKEQLEINQIGFYKGIFEREMKDIEGQQCKGCGQKRVYLMEEKQTRRSDEATTKFFECMNCGDKFRI